MAQESVEETLEGQVGDFLFGQQEEEQQEEQEEEYQPEKNAQPEGDEESDEESEESDGESEEELEASDDEPETVEIEVDGEILEVPAKYKDYFMRQSDYTQKTQELASQRKEVELRAQQFNQQAEQQKFAQSIQNELLEVYEAQQEVKNLQDYLEQNAREMGAQDFQTVQVELKKRERKIAELSGTLQQKYQEHQQAVEHSRKELRDKSTEVLRSKIPNWGENQENEIKSYALSLGVPEQIYETVVDPVEKEILYKAMRYDQLKAKSGDAVAKVKAAPTIKSKSRNPMPKDVQAKLNLRKKLKNEKLSTSDKANLIGEDIASRFF